MLRKLQIWSLAFSRALGVTNVGVHTPIMSWVRFSSSRSLGPGTSMIFMAMLTKPTSRMSSGRLGPGPEKRT